MAEVVIEFKNVTKRYKLFKNDKKRLLALFFKNIKYKEKKAVNNVSFKIHRGETVALFGKNGAGKSTILKLITGVCFPTSGEITVNGRVSALLELTSGFDPEFTGRENIYLKGQLLGLKNSEIEELEQTIIDFAEIEEYIDQPVRTYSSGMKARLGFSINVNIKPEILIVDEALSVGDEEFKNKCITKVNEIINKEDVTLLFVTHITSTAKEFCKRGIFMKDGKIVYDGNIEELLDFYTENEQVLNLSKKIHYVLKIDDTWTCFHIDFVKACAQLCFETRDQFLYEQLYLRYDLTPSRMQDAKNKIGIEKMQEMFQKIKEIKIPQEVIPSDLYKKYLIKCNESSKTLKKL